MRVVQLTSGGLSLADVAVPEPGSGEVLVRVSATGLCHSDLTLMDRAPQSHPFALPLVLGHEVAGVVAAHGLGPVTGPAVGTPVVVHGPWGCGHCRQCATGSEHHCREARRSGIFPPGLGSPGGLAEFLVVPDGRHLLPTGALPPTQAAPLADAGATARHAVRRVEASLGPGSHVVIVGVGGLGHVAVQLVRTLTEATVVAVDTSHAALDLSAELGAHQVVGPAEDPVERVRELTHGDGADAVLDFVATATTMTMGRDLLAVGGHLVLVGVGADTLPVAVSAMPLGATVHTPYWGSLSDLRDVVALAAEGRLRVVTREWDLARTEEAYAAMRAGDLVGRAVVRIEQEQP